MRSILDLYSSTAANSTHAQSIAAPPTSTWPTLQTMAAGSVSRVYSSPIGPLKLTAAEEGIVAVKFLFGKHEEVEGARHVAARARDNSEDGLEKDLTMEADEPKAESHLNVCSKWLDAYFQGTLLKSGTPPPRPKLALGKTGTYWCLASQP